VTLVPIAGRFYKTALHGEKMDWAAVLTIAAVNIALMALLRADMKAFEIKIENWMEDFRIEIRQDLASFKSEVQREMRDFHGRLCALEARWHGENPKPKSKS
jgi:hypothetical protein